MEKHDWNGSKATRTSLNHLLGTNLVQGTFQSLTQKHRKRMFIMSLTPYYSHYRRPQPGNLETCINRGFNPKI
jgi:hypothetical protein